MKIVVKKKNILMKLMIVKKEIEKENFLEAAFLTLEVVMEIKTHPKF